MMAKHLDRFEAYLCAAIFLAMTVLGFVNVVVRYLTSYSFAATQEFLLSGFLLLTVFGGASAARHGDHLAVTFFADLLGGRANRAVRVLASALSVALLLLAAWFCWDLVTYQRQSGVTSAALQIPVWYYSAGLPLGFALIALRLVQRTVAELRGDEGGAGGSIDA